MASRPPPLGTGANPPRTIHQLHGATFVPAAAAAAAAAAAPTPLVPTMNDDAVMVSGDGDNDDEDEDDGYASASDAVAGDDIYSLTPSVTDFVYKHGRSFHRFREGRYPFPNDAPEQRRELMKHDAMVLLCGVRLHYAPLRNPQRILDVGTGVGAWVEEMGDKYPGAAVIGLDLSPIQLLMQPPNVSFIIDDAEDEWNDPPNTLDFVRLGNMAPSIRDWPKLFRNAYTSLKPGGWIELHEFRWTYGCDDDTMPADYGPARMVELLDEALRRVDTDMHAAERNPARLRDAGFVDIRHTVKKVPVGPWPKDDIKKLIGMLTQDVVYEGLEAITLRPFVDILEWSHGEVASFLDEVRRDLENPSVHSYVYFHILLGQKPHNL
ncbi:methyltransferase domain-containing protein [Colletotrichum navitas]|uniref:Methyltransferase domain-containing protein n=1 Tax=Colletotrichum navitas TaxID=681940 RepID=A0AAD8UYP7_9PEZI|nr:methyltransferase domain-containing protein [Colletotrichum navitas]KAK1574046.1 methyltransferase domain-containing protein [Colletotrichum navitas]